MIDTPRRRYVGLPWWQILAVALVLLAAAYLGFRPSRRWLVLLAGPAAVVVLLAKPALASFALVVAALVVPLEFGTGTEVALNLATLLVPALVVLWLVTLLLRGELRVAPSRANAPLLYFLLAGLFSLLLGNVLWDSAVPKSSHFWLVQLAQWAIFAFAAGTFWLTANMIGDEIWLRRLTVTFLALGGLLAAGRVTPPIAPLIDRISTLAVDRPPFWLLLAALAGGQLLFNDRLNQVSRLLLLALLVVVLVGSFAVWRESRSTWVGVGVALAVLVWLRWPRTRRLVLLLVVALTASGLLLSAVWEFAGGQETWLTSGESRLVLIGRVIGVTMRNPITGLGPASYRPYANLEPLKFGRAFWVNPQISSHNNYVDIFAQTGLVGVALFASFSVALAKLGLRLRQSFPEGFLAGYINAMLAAGAASLVIMLLADWILPFVYNIGFPGFQASLLIWLFLGGLVAIDHLEQKEVRQ